MSSSFRVESIRGNAISSHYGLDQFPRYFFRLTEKINLAVRHFFDEVSRWIKGILEINKSAGRKTEPNYSHLRINPKKLPDAPPCNTRIEELFAVLESISPPIATTELLDQFDHLFRLKDPKEIFVTVRREEIDNAGRKAGRFAHVSFEVARKLISEKLIQFCFEEKETKELYLQRRALCIETFIKGIVFELRSDRITSDQKKEVFVRLVNAAYNCPPRRYEEVLEIYQTIYAQPGSMRDIILGYIQMAKEQLFLQHYYLSKESTATLNYIRKTVGKELGLDCSPVNLEDIYIGMHEARSAEDVVDTTPQQFKDAFRRIYTPANLLPLIKEYLNGYCERNPKFVSEVSQLIDQEVRKTGSKKTINELPFPYQDPDTYLLTGRGVAFLLVHFGYLKSSQKPFS